MNLIRSVRTVMRACLLFLSKPLDADGMLSDVIFVCYLAIDNSKLNCNCITFTIWVKINGGNGDSGEELPAEDITSVFIGIYVS
eukprot:bmy_21122T0